VDQVGFLEELVSIPSPSGEEDELAEYLVRRMTDLGLRALRDEAGNVLGEVGDVDAERRVVLVGHMDTVDGHVPVERKDGLLYGRGSVDAKGPLAAFVLAAARVAPALESARVVVVGTVGEEADGRGARHLAQSVAVPCCALIGEPSDWQGVTLGYKGMSRLEYTIRRPRVHGAAMKPSPAEEGVAFWNRLQTYAEQYNQPHNGHFDTLGLSLADFHTFGDGLAEGAQMTVGVRVPLGFQVSDLWREIEGWPLEGETTLHRGDPPHKAEKNTPVVRALLRAIREEGGKPRFKLKTGTSDMNILGPAWRCPMVAYGPGDSALDHTPHEHIDIEEFLRAVNVLERALETLAGQRGG
jgi:LysW-gamma-L-lysine carboxypeptidase